MRRLTHTLFRPCSVLLIRDYSIQRTVVKEGRRISAADTESGKVTPTKKTETDEGPLDESQISDDKHEKSPSDLEKGLERDEDVIGEKEDPEE